MQEKDIDILKKQLDELNYLIDETARPVDSEDDLESKKRTRLGILILKMQDNLLPPRFIRRLEKWLMADRDSLDYYVDFMQLTAMLHFYHKPDLAEKTLASAGLKTR